MTETRADYVAPPDRGLHPSDYRILTRCQDFQVAIHQGDGDVYLLFDNGVRLPIKDERFARAFQALAEHLNWMRDRWVEFGQ